MKNYFYILVLMLSVPNLASADDSSSLLFDGGIGSLIALRDNFFIEFQMAAFLNPRKWRTRWS